MQPQYPTQPMMPQFPQQPGYPQAPAPQYPTAPAQQYPAAPAYPAPMPQYPVAPAPAYPQQYGQPPAPAGPPPAAGTLDGFFEQPSSGGGPSFKFNGKPIGTSYAGIVARPVTNADVRHQTNNAGQVQTYRDGRPKLVMVVPMQVQPSPEFPDGVAGWWVKGQARDELARAMAEAGAPVGAPEAGAAIRVTLVGQRPVPNMNPANQYRVEYIRPAGAGAGQPQQAAPTQHTFAQATGAPAVQATPIPEAQFAPAAVVHQQVQPMPQPVQAPMPQPMPQQVQPMPQPVQAPMPQPMPQQVPQPAPAAQAAPQQAPAAAPAGFNEEQAALFAKLTGAQAA